MKKKILIFSLAYFPHVGGAEIAVKEITDRIHADDIEFHLITLRFSSKDEREEKLGNVFIHRVGYGSSYVSKMLFILLAARRAAQLEAELGIDAWWSLMTYMVLPAALLRMRGHLLPYAVTLQDGDPFEHVFGRLRILPFRLLLKKGFAGASVVQVISQSLKAWPKELGYAGEVEVIPNGVDTERFSRELWLEVRTRIRRELALKPDDLLLVTTSRLVKKNAVDVVIRALALLPEHIHFVVVGSGVEERALKRLVKKLKLSARVHFVGNKTHQDLPAYVQVSQIFVRPSRSEGMGNSFIEAFAAGVPVIATQEGGIADFLFDAKRNPGIPQTGFAVDVDSPEQAAEAVRYILSNPTEVQGVIENAKKLAAEKYDWSIVAKAMRENVFGKLLQTD